MEVYAGISTRRDNFVWLNIRLRYRSNEIGPNERLQMYDAVINAYQYYYENYLRAIARRYLGIQGSIRLASGAFFSMAMSRNYENIFTYVNTLFDYLELMAMGANINTSGLRFHMSGDDVYEPQDILSATINLKVGFEITDNTVPLPGFEFNVDFEDIAQQAIEGVEQREEEERRDIERELEREVQEELERRREEEMREEAQQQRRLQELVDRIELLRMEVRNLQGVFDDNVNLLNDLRQARRRFDRTLIDLRSNVQNQNVDLRRRISELQRQIRGLQRLLNSENRLTSEFEPTGRVIDVSQVEDVSSPSSPFFVPDEYIIEAADSDQAIDDILNFFAVTPSPTVGDSSDTEIIASEELQRWRADDRLRVLNNLRRERLQNRVLELNDEITRYDYEINIIDDSINDLRGTRVKRNRKEYRDLLSQLEEQRKQFVRNIQKCRRELRQLRRELEE